MSVDPVEVVRAALQGDEQSILLLGAVYLFLVCGYSVIFQLRMRAWPSTVGALHGAAVEKFGATNRIAARQDYIGRALYEYVVEHSTYQGKRISPWIIVASHNMRFLLDRQLRAVDSDDNGNVTVYYNPAKPQKSVLIRPGIVGVVMTSVIGIAPLLFVLTSGGSSR